MAQLYVKYPFDPTGNSPTNLVANVEITLPRVNNRAFAPDAGPFYQESFELWHIATGDKLVLNTDYQLLVLNERATQTTRKPVVSLVYVTNPAYSEGFRYTLQVVGGEYTSNGAAIQQMIDSLELDGRSIAWDDILDKPVLFPPAPHLHDVADWYGMEAIVEAVNDLATIVQNGDVVLKEQILTQLSALQALSDQTATRVTQMGLTVGTISDRVTALGG